jgi:hypothetical protein
MADQTSVTTQQNAISAYAQPYVENLLGKTQALTNEPYQPFSGQRTADFTDLQNQAFQGAGQLGVAPQMGQATGLAGMSGIGGLGVAGQATNQGFQNQVGGYMNPYLQYSLAPQLAEANRNYDISGLNQQAKATQAGAFGGSREAIMAAENERNRNMGLQSIIGQGYNTAFGQAQNQYNQNLSNQLQGYGMAGNAANTLGQLGQTQFGQQQGAINTQNQIGTQQQQQQQSIMNQQYQDFLAQKQNPYNQLSFMQSMLSGLPMQSTVQNVYSNPSLLSQVAGLGLTGAAVGNAFPTLFKADGGAIKEQRPAGLAELAIHQMG